MKPEPTLERDDDNGPFLPDYLLFQLAAASAAASERFHAIVRENGLRVPEYRALVCLNDEDGLMVTRLAEMALLEQSRMTRIIVQMDRDGFVTRISDPQDRRRVRVHLTEKGRALAGRMVTLARAHEADLLRAMPGRAGAQLKRLLSEFRTALAAREHQDRPDASGDTPPLT